MTGRKSVGLEIINIDRQRIAAVKKLTELGWGYSHTEGWLPPKTTARTVPLRPVPLPPDSEAAAILRAGKKDRQQRSEDYGEGAAIFLNDLARYVELRSPT